MKKLRKLVTAIAAAAAAVMLGAVMPQTSLLPDLTIPSEARPGTEDPVYEEYQIRYNGTLSHIASMVYGTEKNPDELIEMTATDNNAWEIYLNGQWNNWASLHQDVGQPVFYWPDLDVSINRTAQPIRSSSVVLGMKLRKMDMSFGPSSNITITIDSLTRRTLTMSDIEWGTDTFYAPDTLSPAPKVKNDDTVSLSFTIKDTHDTTMTAPISKLGEYTVIINGVTGTNASHYNGIINPLRKKYWVLQLPITYKIPGSSDGQVSTYTDVTPDVTVFLPGYYVVKTDTTVDGIAIFGSTDPVNLILCDGATLTVNNGICVPKGSNLHIYAQSTGDDMGALIAHGEEKYAGIGGMENTAGGQIEINGGKITAYGGDFAAGIGGGKSADVQGVEIKGGKVTAYGGAYGGAGIGGGANGEGGFISVQGGEVTAVGGGYSSETYMTSGAGIGGGAEQGGGMINITGGTVTATGNLYAAGIGGGSCGSGGRIRITDGTVNATGGVNGGAAIGGGYAGDGGIITFVGGTVTSDSSIKIGHGKTASGGTDTISVTGGTFTFWEDVMTGWLASGKAAVKSGETYTVGNAVSYLDPTKSTPSQTAKLYSVLNNTMTTLTDGTYVLNSDYTVQSRITISGTVNIILCDGKHLIALDGICVNGDAVLNIFAQSTGSNMGHLDAFVTSDCYKAAIGSNNGERCGTIVINGGKIEAESQSNMYGYAFAAAIGGGEACTGGTIIINGGDVTAKDVSTNQVCAAIGNFDNGTITINGGKVLTDCNSYGIGTGEGCMGGTITINGGNVKSTCRYGIGGNYARIILNWTKPSDSIEVIDYAQKAEFVRSFVIQGTTTAATTENISGKTIVPAYKIGFDTNGGFDLDPMYAAVAASGTATVSVSDLPTPERKGSVFVGWSEDSSDIGDTLTLTADTVLKAVWECGDIDYTGADGKPAKVLAGEYEYITDGDNSWGTDSTGTYVVGGDIEINETVTLNRDINLILLDGAKLTIDVDDRYCIYGDDISLSVFGQSSENAGELILKNSNNEGGGIRVNEYSQYGGTVAVTEIHDGALYVDNDITISGGTVNATSKGNDCTAICSVNDITITGGEVTATANGDKCIAIDSVKHITISGGTVTATSNGNDCTAIYSSYDITITGGEVTATSNGDYCIDICSVKDIKISGGKVKVTGLNKGIYAYGSVNITGGQTDAGSIIYANGNISLGWTGETDSIYAAEYKSGSGKIILLNKFILADSEEDATVDNINGKTLIPKPEGVRVAKVTAPGAKQLRFEGVFTLPEGAEKLTYAALIATTKDSIGENLTYENCSYLKGKSNPTAFNDDGEFLLTWTRSGVTSAQTWYVRPYIKYTMNGKTYKEYGKIVKVKLVNGEAVKCALNEQVYTVTVTGNGYIGEKGIQATAVEEGMIVDVTVSPEYFEGENNDIAYSIKGLADENGDKVKYEDFVFIEDMIIFKVRPTGNLTVTPVYITNYKVTASGSTSYIEPGEKFSLTVPEELDNFNGWNVNGKFIKYDGDSSDETPQHITINEPTEIELVYESPDKCRIDVNGGYVVGYEPDSHGCYTVPKGTKVTIAADRIGDYWMNVSNGESYNGYVITIIAESSEYYFALPLRPASHDVYVGVISGIQAKDSGITFSAEYAFPEGAAVRYAGIIATTKDSVGYDLNYENCSYIKGKSNPVFDNIQSFEINWTKTGIKEGQTWYVRTYLKYELDGKIYKKYGDVIAVQLIDGKLVCMNPVTELSD